MPPIWRLQRVLHQLRHALVTPSRNARTAVVLGRLLAVAFVLCLATGIYSHLLREPQPGMVFPTRPLWLYQVTQGLHIRAGIACFPLLFAKLYAVFPQLFQTPPVRSFAHFLERGSIALFVAASLVQITIGLLNTYQLYAIFPFSFRAVHFRAVVRRNRGAAHSHRGKSSDHHAVLAQEGCLRRGGDLTPLPAAVAPDPDVPFDAPDELRRVTGRPMNAGITGWIFE